MTSPLHRRNNYKTQLWCPGLAANLITDLVAREPQLANGGLNQYSTERWLQRNGTLPIEQMGSVKFGQYLARVEFPGPITKATFDDLMFADGPQHVVERLQAAADVMQVVESLPETVGCLVRSIHPLSAPPDYDISHSAPELPFSIFVSIPGDLEHDATIRVAESLIHEAMHLKLTLIERSESLINGRDAFGFSPWKQEIRPVAGLLHGLYVFAVIFQVLSALADQTGGAGRSHIAKRQAAIRAEVAQLPDMLDGLSPLGRLIWRRSRDAVLTPSEAGHGANRS